tara:strand:+ start:824 stop:1060 length:237 start_codon:yes stop_codon:yes gene_type:complete
LIDVFFLSLKEPWEIAHILTLPIGNTEARIPKAKLVLVEKEASKIPAIKLAVKEVHRATRLRFGNDTDRRNRSEVVTI